MLITRPSWMRTSPTRCARLVDAGILVLNQSVLLRGVNDAADTLIALNVRLLDLRVMPYYLHQLDQVAGAAHFHVPIERGRQLVAAMRAQLPGYAVPRYVCEEPGRASKTLLSLSTPRGGTLFSRSRLVSRRGDKTRSTNILGWKTLMF